MRGVWLAAMLLGCAGGSDCEEVTWFVDGDGDGFGSGSAVVGCAEERPATAANVPGDCNDADAEVRPGAVEVCNDIDDNCDSRVDDADPALDTTTQTDFYPDVDDDGFGADVTPVRACTAPPTSVDRAGDCDDNDVDTYPGAPETCKHDTDTNCDGIDPQDDGDSDGVFVCIDCDDKDAKTGGPTTWYGDMDQDGFGDPARPNRDCDRPNNHVDNGDDCDDTSADFNPNAVEVCDTLDNDCDSLIDDADGDIVGQQSWYSDDDNDALGTMEEAGVLACGGPPGMVANSLDCDDGTQEVGVAPSWYPDLDSDTFGDVAGIAVVVCDAPANHIDNNDDCDDGDAAINPGTYWFEDADEDTYGNVSVTLQQCAQPAGYVLDEDDCDDTDHVVHPGRFDFDDDIDNDCDTSVDEDVGNETHDSTLVQAIVDSECAKCHTDGGSSGSLELDDLFGDTVGVAATGLATMSLIEPGDRRNSYLWNKLVDTHLDVGGAGDQMPQGSAPLADADLEDFEDWILQGAIE